MNDYEKGKLAIRLRRAGIAEGLRMAAEILHNSKVRNDFYQQIISKAKEIEESAGKGEK